MLSFSSLILAECPIIDFDATSIQIAIDNASTCYEAADIAKECAFGSSIDVQFVGSALKTCEKDFVSISELEIATYNGLVNQCYKKYANLSGTMYRSFESFCALSVAEAFSSVFSTIE